MPYWDPYVYVAHGAPSWEGGVDRRVMVPRDVCKRPVSLANSQRTDLAAWSRYRNKHKHAYVHVYECAGGYATGSVPTAITYPVT